MLPNTSVHLRSYMDCDGFPPDVNDKVKEKMSTSKPEKVTCERCKRRLQLDGDT